jgi:hypothetical protein
MVNEYTYTTADKKNQLAIYDDLQYMLSLQAWHRAQLTNMYRRAFSFLRVSPQG